MAVRLWPGIVGLAILVAAARPAQAWLAVLSGTGGGNDVTEAAALLPNGDVVVTGSVQNGATHEDLLAVRLDARSGRPVWRVEVNGESVGRASIVPPRRCLTRLAARSRSSSTATVTCSR